MAETNLTNCDVEPIHIPGKIQAHGFLVAVNSNNFAIKYVSDNIEEHLGVEPKEILGKNISFFNKVLQDKAEVVDLENLLTLGARQAGFDIINPYKIKINEQPFYLIIHKSNGSFVLEFEPATLEYDIQNVIGKAVSEILINKSLDKLLTKTAQEVKNMIEYDRIMIYKFHEDGHGEVVSEVKNDELEPFFGLHYPASDIPKQARELYKLNLTRIIADVNVESVAISADSTVDHLDLTQSTLRAVSPIHIQYLKNMGVASSFSISLISQGELWGLIACHNYSPKFIDFKAREGCKLIGNILSSALEYRQVEEDTDLQNHYTARLNELSENLERDKVIVNALTAYPTTLLDIVNAKGVALVFEDKIYTKGETPNNEELKELFDWLKLTMTETIYHTKQLSTLYKPGIAFKNIGSGILACMLSKDMGELIVWFKPEQLQTVNWAGNPDKQIEMLPNGEAKISPRNSFATWAQIVANTSLSWSNTEISGVLKIREKINNAINKTANEIRLLNERLKLAYEELDTFSYTISHDLRTPLTSIKSYTELFLLKNNTVDEQGKNLLSRVLSGADKMQFLIDEILKLARVGRAEFELSKINMQELIDEAVNTSVAAYKAFDTEIIVSECPQVSGDQTLIGQVFSNIIGNAVKYSSKAEKPTVKINAVLRGEEVIYSISDNGIGIDVNHHDKVFELFKRMENVKDFEGTGVGLAIVKRIIERHNGRIWFESELEKGTTFYIALKK